MLGGMLGQEPGAKVRDSRPSNFQVSDCREIYSLPDCSPKALSFLSRRLRSPRRTMIADSDPSLASAYARLENVDLPVALPPYAKAFDLGIPKGHSGRETIDSPLGDPRFGQGLARDARRT
jgi:hypothetical protein